MKRIENRFENRSEGGFENRSERILENRFEKRFLELKKKNEAGFMPFVVLGDPDFETSFKIMKALIDSGADALELGFAFSDPVADGPTVQEAGQRALKAGSNTLKCLELIKRIRSENNEIPISLLLYGNIVVQHGTDKFYSDCSTAGVDAVLLADVPAEESDEFVKSAKNYGIEPVFIVSPTTEEERLGTIIEKAGAYVYLVGVLGVTGARIEVQNMTVDLVKRIKPKTSLPVLVGFGISSSRNVKNVIEAGADGAIVGSAIVQKIKDNLGNSEKTIEEISDFARELKKATLSARP